MVVTWIPPSRCCCSLRGWWSHNLEGIWVPELLSEQSCLPSWTVTGEKNKVVSSVDLLCSAELPHVIHYPCFSAPETRHER